MKLVKILTLCPLFFSFFSFACSKVEKGYEDKDTMYSVCPNFPALPDDSASKLVDVLLSQYEGPPDEILIYFVASAKSVGKVEFQPGELLGYYYSHNHSIVIWPNTPKEKVVEVTWAQ